MEMVRLKKFKGVDLFIGTTFLLGLTAISFIAYAVKTFGNLIELDDDVFEELDEESEL